MAEKAEVLSRVPGALNHADAFRAILLDRAGVKLEDRAKDRRTCCELATQVFALTGHSTPHHAILQSACQVIDDFVLALKPIRDGSA
jgi:hypothetical protein